MKRKFNYLDDHTNSRNGSFYQEGSYRSHLFNVMEKIGICKYSLLAYVVTFMVYFVFGSEFSFVEVNFEILAYFWDVSTSMLLTYKFLIRISLAVGALIVGVLVKQFDRVQVLINSIICYLIFTLFASVFHNFWWFTLTRCLSNAAISISLILSTNLLTEYLPVKERQFYLMMCITFFVAGKIYFVFTNSFFYSQSFDSTRFKTSNFLTCIPILIPFFITLCYIRDSPIYLFSKSKDFEGFMILSKMAKDKNVEFVESDKHIIKRDLINKNNYILKFNFFELAKSEYRVITLICLFTHIFCYFNSSATMPAIIRAIDYINGVTRTGEDPRLSNEARSILQCSFVSLGSGVIAYYMSIVHWVGKRKGLVICQVLAAILSFSCLLVNDGVAILYISGTMLMLNLVSEQLIVIYIAEIFPTRLRDYAQSSIFFFSFLIASFIPFLIHNLSTNDEIIKVYILLGINSLIGAFFSYFIKIETFNRPLDLDSGITDE